MKKSQLGGALMLLLTAFIWGSSFVAQSVGMDYVGGFTFNGIRTLMGAAVLLPYLVTKDLIKIKKTGRPGRQIRSKTVRKTVIHGLALGVVLCVASNIQQFAFNYTESGKIAFITAFYMFFVPLFGLFFKRRVSLPTWLAVIMGTVGLYFLCIRGIGFSEINRGDVLSFICAVFFAVHITAVEMLAKDDDPVKISCVQFITSGAISVILMFIFEKPQLAAINGCMTSLLYSGIMSCGLAYTFQIVGQKKTEPTLASLIMCLESVFGVLCSAAILHEDLTADQKAGCSIMFAAIILSVLSDRITGFFREKKNRKA